MNKGRPQLVACLALGLLVTACGGASAPGGGAAASGGGAVSSGGGPVTRSRGPAAAGQFARTASVSHDDERVPYGLEAGNYNLFVRAPGCDDPEVAITQDGGDFTFSKILKNAPSDFVDDVPEGAFFIEVVTDCETWSVSLNWIGN